MAGRSLAEYEYRSALLRGPDEALPRQDQTAAAPTVSKERRDRRKKTLLKEEAEQVKETREAQAAQAMADSNIDSFCGKWVFYKYVSKSLFAALILAMSLKFSDYTLCWSVQYINVS